MKILDFKGFLTHPALGPELPKQSRAAKQEALPVGEKCRERRYAHRFTIDAEAPSDRVDPIAALRARALLRNSFGDLEAAKAVLERLAELAGALDETAPDDTASKPRTTQAVKRSEAARRSAMAPARKK